MTFRPLNRTVPFLAHPVGILCENGVGKNSARFCGTVRVLLYISCTRAWCSAKCRCNVFYSTFTNVFFLFCQVFLRFLTFWNFCLNVFYICVRIYHLVKGVYSELTRIHSQPDRPVIISSCQWRQSVEPLAGWLCYAVDPWVWLVMRSVESVCLCTHIRGWKL